MAEFMNAIRSEDVLQTCVSIVDDVYAKNFYGALITCKKLLVFEQDRLDFASGRSRGSVAAAAMRGDGPGEDE
jgi:flagellar biosynthesis regulator FlbT